MSYGGVGEAVDEVDRRIPGEFLPHVFDDEFSRHFSPGLIRQSSHGIQADALTPLVSELKHVGVADGTEWWQSLLVILASVVGVGVLYLPEAVATLGWVPGAVAMAFGAFSSWWSGRMYTRLVLAAPKAQVLADIVVAAYGPQWRNFTMFLGYTNIAGTSVVYHLTASQSLQQLFAGVPYVECQPVAGLCFGLLMLPALQAQSMHAVSVVSLVGCATIAVALIIVFAKLIANGPNPANHTSLVEPFAPHHWAAAFACCLFAFTGQEIFVELISRQREFWSFKRAVDATTAVAVCMYTFTAFMGYYYIGRDVRGPITSSLPIDFWTHVVNACLFIHVAIAYLIDMNVLTDAMLRLLWPRAMTTASSSDVHAREAVAAPATHSASQAARVPWLVMSSALVGIAYVLESSIPFSSELVSLIGASTGTMIMLFIPAVCALRLLPMAERSTWLWLQCYVAMIAAILFMILGSSGAIVDIFRALSDTSRPAPWACAATS